MDKVEKGSLFTKYKADGGHRGLVAAILLRALEDCRTAKYIYTCFNCGRKVILERKPIKPRTECPSVRCRNKYPGNLDFRRSFPYRTEVLQFVESDFFKMLCYFVEIPAEEFRQEVRKDVIYEKQRRKRKKDTSNGLDIGFGTDILFATSTGKEPDQSETTKEGAGSGEDEGTGTRTGG